MSGVVGWTVVTRQLMIGTVNYLLYHRLQWGKPDSLSLLPSRLVNSTSDGNVVPRSAALPDGSVKSELPPIPADAPTYFTTDTPSELISIIMNDWPYSGEDPYLEYPSFKHMRLTTGDVILVPPEIEHALVWTRLPVIPPDLPSSVAPRILQDGLWGFTGLTSPPPSPSLLPQTLPALSDWGVTMDHLVRSPRGTDEEEELVRKAGEEVSKFIKARWVEQEWETAWFVNPPVSLSLIHTHSVHPLTVVLLQRLQSVPGLAHIHVFARHKSPEENSLPVLS